MWQVEYYETSGGRRPVEDFIDSVDTKSKARIARTVDLLEEFGIDLGMPYARHLEKDLWELRVRASRNQYRIIYFLFADGVFVLLHGLAKKSGRLALHDFKTARDRRDDFLSRRM